MLRHDKNLSKLAHAFQNYSLPQLACFCWTYSEEHKSVKCAFSSAALLGCTGFQYYFKVLIDGSIDQ